MATEFRAKRGVRTKILVFGDSIAYGSFDSKGGWVQRLKESLDERILTDPNPEYSVHNFGVSGDTTEDLLARFESEAKQAERAGEEMVIIFAIGINDAQSVHGKKSIRTPLREFRKNIEGLVRLARKHSRSIVFVGLTPVDESRTDPIPWDRDRSYRNENVRNCNGIIRSACKRNNIHFIDVFGKMMKSDYKRLLCDGLHPNSEGHKRLYGMIKASLYPMLLAQGRREKPINAQSVTANQILRLKRARLQPIATRIRWAWLCWRHGHGQAGGHAKIPQMPTKSKV